MRKVLTVNELGFDNLCTLMQERISDLSPDLIVGIATGGEMVARKILPSVSHVTATARRCGSNKKNGRVRVILKKIPLPVADMLRIAESVWLSRQKPAPRVVDMPDNAVMAIRKASRIVIVDDACDSGATLRAVLDAVSSFAPEARIYTAVITVTTARPMVVPDISLFNNFTLIRFPWSADAR